MKTLNKWAIPLKLLGIVFCIFTAVFIAYYDALNNNFMTLWDTQGYVIENVHIRAFNWENIWWMFSQFHLANWHPLTWLSHALDYALFGLEPWGHHFVNILIHGFNSLLVFALVIVLMSFKKASIDNKILLAAGVAAILFGIHPQHVESVAWVAERKDVLCLFFILLTLISYVFYVEKARRSWYFVTIVCFVLALLAKPMAVTLPVILLLMDVYPLNRTRLTTSAHVVSYTKLLIEKIPFFMFTVCSIILTLLAQQNAMLPVEQLGIVSRVLNAFNTLFLYLAKFIFPVGLSPFYPLQGIINIVESPAFLIPIIGTLCITILCVYLWFQKKYYWLITWLFYLVTLSPVIGIIQVGGQAAADRYVYLPTIPFYILLGLGFSQLLYAEKIKKSIKLGSIIGLLCISIVLTQLTQKQTHIWKNDFIFWSYAVAYSPDNGMLHYYLAYVYERMGIYDKSLEHYNKAISLSPHKKNWYPSILRVYLQSNQLEQALNFITPPIEYNIDIGLTLDYIYYVKGLIHHKQGLPIQAQKALTHALELNSNLKVAQELLLKINTENP
ncbi:MAG: tetratricopeptide repeat protein [Thiomargarita sp.]|nr:tetratricopeptide repeat protein [Thiomargarita sp.]